MNWDAISAVGEIIGAVAVVGSLFYLAIQIRQNNRAVDENSRQLRLSEVDATLQAFSRFRNMIVDPQTAALFSKGLNEFDSLAESEKIQVGAVLDEYLFAYWSVYRRYKENAYAEADWNAHLGALSNVLKRTGAAQWWQTRQSAYPPDFANHLNETLEAR